MKNVLVVVDMQKDFIDGALGTKEAAAIVDNVAQAVRAFDGEVVFTRMITWRRRRAEISRCRTVSREPTAGSSTKSSKCSGRTT